ncbi:hypothetical protein CPB85DRAFT_1266522, partial [Mucidula mucida]
MQTKLKTTFCSCLLPGDSEEFLSIVDNQILGVVRITVQSAHLSKAALTIPFNPFVKITTDVGEQKFYTNPCRHTHDPNWLTETLHIPISSLDSGLHLAVKNRIRFFQAPTIGSAFLSLDHILDAPDQDTVTLPLTSPRGRVRGQILVSVSFSPTQTTDHPSDVGIVRLLLYEAHGLQRSTPRRKPNPRASVQWMCDEDGPTPMFSTPVCRNTCEPTWNSCYDFICARKLTTTL